MHVFVIPGNPPAQHFYQLWAKEIEAKYQSVRVMISPYPNTLTSLTDTITTHGQTLRKFHLAHGQPIKLVGHSLGGWIALHLLNEHLNLINKCLLIAPFLERPGLKGRMILKGMHWLDKSQKAQRLLLKQRPFLNRWIRDLEHVTDREIALSIALAAHEHRVIGRGKIPIERIQSVRDKLQLIYCDRDKWCPPKTVKELNRWIPCEKLEIQHDFITDKSQRHKVLESI